MSSQGSAFNLIQAYKDLSAKWQQTESGWHDAKSQQFQQTYLAPLSDEVQRAAAAMSEIDNLIRKIRSECG
jgi:hypothetical protein